MQQMFPALQASNAEIYLWEPLPVLLDAYREVMDENRHRWPLSFPPLEALAKDVAVWWQEHARRRAGKAPMRPFGGSVADSGVAHTLSGVSASVHE